MTCSGHTMQTGYSVGRNLIDVRYEKKTNILKRVASYKKKCFHRCCFYWHPHKKTYREVGIGIILILKLRKLSLRESNEPKFTCQLVSDQHENLLWIDICVPCTQKMKEG